MTISPEQYQLLRKKLTTPGAQLTDEQRTFAIEATAEFDNAHSQAAAQPELAQKLDPTFSTIPQALAVSPTTTHPDGDEAAESEFRRSGGTKGSVIVYEPPLKTARDELLAKPELVAYLSQGDIVDPQELAELGKNHWLYQAYADDKWRRKAEETAQEGKTAYRYSKTPFLQEGEGSAVESLGLRLSGAAKGLAEGMDSFVLGVDHTGAIGMGRAAGEAANPQIEATKSPGVESSGGIPTTDLASRNQILEDEHPVANAAGQAVGLFLLPAWAPANALFKAATGVTRAAVGEGAGLVARTGAAAVGAGLGGAAVDATREGAQAASNAVRTGGDPGTTFAEAAGRVGQNAVSPVGPAALGTGLHILGEAATGVANTVRHGDRYGGAPGRFEQGGGKIKFGKGPVSAEADAAVAKGRGRDVVAQDTPALELAPVISRAAKEHVQQTEMAIADRKAPFLNSGEGQMLLPVKNTMQEAADRVLELHTATDEGGRLRLINPADDKAAASATTDFFNGQIAGVTTKKTEGAIALTPEQADVLLLPKFKNDLVPKKDATATSGARELDLEAPPAPAEGDFVTELRRRGADTVYVVPHRYNAEDHETLLKSVQKLGADPNAPQARFQRELYQAAFRDRDARPMNNVPGGWSAFQRENMGMVKKAKEEAGLVAPGGNAFNPLVDFAQQRPGQLPLVEAVRAAANRSGVREQLDSIRQLSPYQQMTNQMSSGPRMGPGGRPSFVGSTFDQLMMRLGYPTAHALETPAIRSGMGGRVGTAGGSVEEKKRKRAAEAKETEE